MSRRAYFDQDFWEDNSVPGAINLSCDGSLALMMAEEIVVMVPTFPTGGVYESSWACISSQTPVPRDIKELSGVDLIDAWLDSDKTNRINFKSVQWSHDGAGRGQPPLLLGLLDDGAVMIFEVAVLTAEEKSVRTLNHTYELKCNGIHLALISEDFFPPISTDGEGVAPLKVEAASWLNFNDGGPPHLALATSRGINVWRVEYGSDGRGPRPVHMAAADLLCPETPSDCIVAMDGFRSCRGRGQPVVGIYAVSSCGYIVKAALSDCRSQLSVLCRYRQVDWVQTPTCRLIVLPDAVGTFLHMSSGDALVSYLDTSTSREAIDVDVAVSDIVPNRSDVGGIVTDICPLTRRKVDEDGAITVPVVASLFEGKLITVHVSVPADHAASDVNGRLMPLASRASRAVDNTRNGVKQMGVVTDNLGLMLYHAFTIPGADVANHASQLVRHMRKPHLGFSTLLDPTISERWCAYGDVVVKFVLDRICFSRKIAMQECIRPRSESLLGVASVLLYSALKMPPPSYYCEVMERGREYIETGAVAKPSAEKKLTESELLDVVMDVDLEDDVVSVEEVKKKKKLRPLYEPEIEYFGYDDNTGVLEVTDIFVRAVFLCCDAIDKLYTIDKVNETPAADATTTEENVRSTCEDLITLYRFDAIALSIKYMGGIESLLNIEGPNTASFSRLLFVIDDPELLSIKLRLMQSVHASLKQIYRCRGMSLQPNAQGLMDNIKIFVQISFFAKSLVRLLSLLKPEGTTMAAASTFSLGTGPFMLTEIDSGAGAETLHLSARECATAMKMVQFLFTRAEYIEDAAREVTSFQPIMSRELSTNIIELCNAVSSCLRDQPVFKNTVCPRLYIRCPICEEVLMAVDTTDIDCSTTNTTCVLNHEYEHGISCEHCNVFVDKCCFTLLPYLPCSIDENIGVAASVSPLKCRSCGAMCNSSRRGTSVSDDDCRLEYCWLPQNSPRDDGIYYCLYCSIPFLPSFCG